MQDLFYDGHYEDELYTFCDDINDSKVNVLLVYYKRKLRNEPAYEFNF